jgi:hypothetical protein
VTPRIPPAVQKAILQSTAQADVTRRRQRRLRVLALLSLVCAIVGFFRMAAAVEVVLGCLVVSLILWVGALFLQGAHRRRESTVFLGEQDAYDLIREHPYVLYLRPFKSDRERSVPALTATLGRSVPVIAIAEPGSSRHRLGCLVVRAPAETWQTTATLLIRNAALIVVRGSQSPGVMWEMESLKLHADPRRVVVWAGATPDWKTFAGRWEASYGNTLPTTWELGLTNPWLGLPYSPFVGFDEHWGARPLQAIPTFWRDAHIHLGTDAMLQRSLESVLRAGRLAMVDQLLSDSGYARAVTWLAYCIVGSLLGATVLGILTLTSPPPALTPFQQEGMRLIPLGIAGLTFGLLALVRRAWSVGCAIVDYRQLVRRLRVRSPVG